MELNQQSYLQYLNKIHGFIQLIRMENQKILVLWFAICLFVKYLEKEEYLKNLEMYNFNVMNLVYLIYKNCIFMKKILKDHHNVFKQIQITLFVN